ncbi:MAG: hypothetical protein JWO53_275 [Chlamydiia bacterium]|nr:hypothetical protein [Chlamydiia bacterium]
MPSYPLEISNDGKRSALWQMQRDQELIDGLISQEAPLLRLYEWERPTISYGHFIDPEKYLRKESIPFELVKRPTGGGMLFHVEDFVFSVVLPSSHPRYVKNVLESYEFINEIVLQSVLQVCGGLLSLEENEMTGSLPEFCMASPTKYDLLLNGYKIGGSAQRRTQHGFLHQGSIFLTLPPWQLLEESLHDGVAIVSQMKKASKGLCKQEEVEEVRKKLEVALITAFREALNI